MQNTNQKINAKIFEYKDELDKLNYLHPPLPLQWDKKKYAEKILLVFLEKIPKL